MGLGSVGLGPSCAVAAAAAGVVVVGCLGALGGLGACDAAGAGAGGCCGSCGCGAAGAAAVEGTAAGVGAGVGVAPPGWAYNGWLSVRIMTTPEAATSGPSGALEWVSPVCHRGVSCVMYE